MTTTHAQERAFADAVAASEGQKQADIAAASSAGNYNAAIKAAERAHWTRVVDAARANGMTAPAAQFALSQSLAGKTP